MTLTATMALVGHRQWMTFAAETATRSNCIRRAVGAVIVRDSEILSSGCNGVSEIYADCRQAGCPRCIRGGTTGSGYENCICVHAEQAAIGAAAAQGIPLRGSSLYVNLRPCLQCLAISRVAGIRQIFYDEDWAYPEEVESVYLSMAAHFDSFRRVGDAFRSDPTSAFAVLEP